MSFAQGSRVSVLCLSHVLAKIQVVYELSFEVDAAPNDVIPLLNDSRLWGKVVVECVRLAVLDGGRAVWMGLCKPPS